MTETMRSTIANGVGYFMLSIVALALTGIVAGGLFGGIAVFFVKATH